MSRNKERKYENIYSNIRDVNNVEFNFKCK